MEQLQLCVNECVKPCQALNAGWQVLPFLHFFLSLSQCVWCVTTVVVVMHKKVVKGIQKKNALE